MTINLEMYRGREQSFIKHTFLTQYLQAAAYKTLQGRSLTFNFVDAFAGPWQVSDELEYSDASFAQAIRTLELVRADLGKAGIAGLKIRFCFCERRADAVKRLKDYAAKKGRFEIHVFHGSFEDHLDDIATACSDGFTFTFIDPTGWDIRSEGVFEFLKEQRGEFLLNFMSEHINRHAEYQKVSASFGRFLADPEWEDEFNALTLNASNEEKILHLLRQKLLKAGAATYMPDISILKPGEDRIKMRLLLGTHSTRGLEVFRDVQSKVERTEMETRDNLQDSKATQIGLFSDTDMSAIQQDNAGVGCRRYQRLAESRIRQYVTLQPGAKFHDIAVDVMANIPMRITQIKKLVIAMRDSKILIFELPPRKRVPQPETSVSLA